MRSWENSGNRGINKLVEDINKRKAKNNKAGKGTVINLKVEKREDVDWNMTTDENGELEED